MVSVGAAPLPGEVITVPTADLSACVPLADKSAVGTINRPLRWYIHLFIVIIGPRPFLAASIPQADAINRSLRVAIRVGRW